VIFPADVNRKVGNAGHAIYVTADKSNSGASVPSPALPKSGIRTLNELINPASGFGEGVTQ
jgi:hypothetical protein